MDELDVEAAFHAYGAAVLSRCRRILRDEQAARDVMQEVFVRCFTKKDGLRPGRALLGWLYRVATNLSLNALRDARVRATYEAASAQAEPQTADGPRRDQDVLALLSGLDRRTQSIVVFVHLFGMTHAEAGEVAGVTDRTVRNCLARFVVEARRRLGAELGEDQR